MKLDDDDLRALPDTLCADPQVGDLMRDTGGVRKMRLESQGKSRSLRRTSRAT